MAILAEQLSLGDLHLTKPTVARSKVGRGEYYAIDGRVTAFVMLDEDTAPKGEAANDPA
jgi:hypothetical protein